MGRGHRDLDTGVPAHLHRGDANYPAGEEACASYPGGGAPSIYDHRNLGDPLVVNGTLAGVGDELNGVDQDPFLPFERMSLFDFAILSELDRSDPGTQDWTGDGISDVLGEAPNGQLTDYQGMGAYPGPSSGFVRQTLVDQTNWNADPRLLRVTNWDNDGTEGLIAVSSSGVLTRYPSVADTHGIDYAHAVQVGTGWGQFTNLMAFQWDYTSHIGLVGVTPAGDLRFYGTDGSGHWVYPSGLIVGEGFAGLRTVFSTGSFGGTDTGAIMTVDNAGNLKVYLATGFGGWLDRGGIQIGVGFQTLKAVF